MQFVVWATDHAGSLPARQRVREAHRARLRNPAPHAVKVLLAGPTLHSQGDEMNGTLLVIDAQDEAAVRAFIHDDPYTRHGVYASVDIRPWRCGLGPLAPDPSLPP
jgi:uncharacterized protein